MSDTVINIPKGSLNKLLKPVNRLTESCVLRTGTDSIYTLCTSQGVILYAITKVPGATESTKLNIISIKKFLTGLECLGDDNFKISYNQNCITCSSSSNDSGENTKIKYHLVDDGIIKESVINIEKIVSLSFDTVFEIPVSKVKQIMSAYSFVNEVNKIYFYTKDGKVFADVDDKTMPNIDNVSLIASNEFSGNEINVPLSLKIEIFKLLATSKTSIKVKINDEFKVFVFETQEDENTQLKYIISALVK
jgi:hypothetical protein